MKKSTLMATVVLSAVMMSTAFAAENSGEAIFKAKCAPCHPDGGNIINASKPLKGIKKATVITDKIRKGGGGMPVFDTKAISAADAKQLSGYIIKTFKK